MFKNLPIVLTTLLLAAFVLSAAPAGEAPLIPMKDFFRNPEIASFQLSPDGKKLAYTKPWERRMNVFVRDIDGGGERRLTSVTDRDIAGFGWKGDEHIVYMRDKGGDEDFHVWIVPAAGGEERDLTPFDGVRASIEDILKEDPEHILIAMNRRNPEVFDIYRCTLATGDLSLAAENPGDITGWLTDHDGKVRAAMKTDGVNNTLLYRSTEDKPFKELVTVDFQDSFYPLDFTYDNKLLYVKSNLAGPGGVKPDKKGIYTYDPETRKTVDLIFSRPDVDAGGLLMSEKRKVITGATYVTDRMHIRFFDDNRKRLQEELEALLPGYEVAVSNMDDDERRVVCVAYGDRTRGKYYLYDRETKKLELLADLSPWLDENNLATMRPVSYKARDGLAIHGYLTLPVGLPEKNLPLLVIPHGGPWTRDSWGYDSEAQFVANRGAAVLQVNYRGSTGYGRDFWRAGFKEWGKAMQDDITDGVRWLEAEGVVDAKRVGIYGASYGGYAALAGLAFTPDLYACGISYVGPSNLFTLLASFPPYWKPTMEMTYRQIGDPVKDKELLKSVSPYFHADRIRAPLLVAQGANDPRVKKAESDQIVEAVRARGLPVTYMVKENEGHGFHNEENRFDFYREMERFLADHLGLRKE